MPLFLTQRRLVVSVAFLFFNLEFEIDFIVFKRYRNSEWSSTETNVNGAISTENEARSPRL